jgi:hypothetical protein
MGLLDSVTIGLYRQTRDGRRVCGLPLLPGLPKAWYLIGDADVALVDSRFRRLYAITFFVIIPLAVVLSADGAWFWVPIALLGPPVAMRYWVFRGVQRTTVTSQDLLPIDRRARDLSQFQAMGQPTLWLLLVAAVLMGALSAFVWSTDSDWWALFGMALFGAGAVFMARAIIAVRGTLH